MSVECRMDQKIDPRCRVCLTSNLRMCSIENIQLLQIYEKLTNTQPDKDLAICYICYSMLQKSLRFSDMAHKSQKILEDLQGAEVHKIKNMPNFGITLNLSVTHIHPYTESRPDYSDSINSLASEPEVIIKEESEREEDVENVKREVLKEEMKHEVEKIEIEVFEEESMCDVENIKVEVDSLVTDDEELFENVMDATPPVSRNDEPVYQENTSYPSTVKVESLTENEELHEMKTTEMYLNNLQNAMKIPSNNALNISLQQHIKARAGGKVHKCELCNKTYARLGHLETHFRTHTGEKPYECSVCHNTFAYKNILENHMRIHTGEKPYECNICSKTFSRLGNLHIHRRIHTGEKPYQCTMCNKTFSGPGYLQIHVRTHTGEKPYECDECHNTFGRKSILKNHMRTHTGEKPFECHVCHNTFARRHILQNHIRTHTGVKPFDCNICNKMFAQKSHLKKHVRIHSKERPFVCEICNKTFAQKFHLQKHSKTHVK